MHANPPVNVFEDRSVAGGGHAVIRVAGIASSPDNPPYAIRRLGYDKNNLGYDGWQGPDAWLQPMATVVHNAGVDLRVGPEVVDVIDVGTPIEIEIPSLGVRSTLHWPDIAPSVRTPPRNPARMEFADRTMIPDSPMPGDPSPGGYEQGGYEQGGYDQGSYDQGGYDASLSDRTVVQPGSYPSGHGAEHQQPGYDHGAYNQGGYDQGGYDAAGYQQQDYAAAGYNTGGYDQQNYGHGSEGYGQYDQATSDQYYADPAQQDYDDPFADPGEPAWDQGVPSESTDVLAADRRAGSEPGLGAPRRRRSLWWLWLLIVLALLIGGAVAYVTLRDELGLPWPEGWTLPWEADVVEDDGGQAVDDRGAGPGTDTAPPEDSRPPDAGDTGRPADQGSITETPDDTAADRGGDVESVAALPPRRPADMTANEYVRRVLQEDRTGQEAYDLAEEYLDDGDVDVALLLLEYAERLGNGSAMSAIGRMYDPAHFDADRSAFSSPNPARAIELYQSAAAAGDPTARTALEELRRYLEDAAANGDFEAELLLQDDW